MVSDIRASDIEIHKLYSLFMGHTVALYKYINTLGSVIDGNHAFKSDAIPNEGVLKTVSMECFFVRHGHNNILFV
jgi:metallophosphoesterase superfamily enzyme